MGPVTIPSIRLNSGRFIPALGYGTGTAWFKRQPGELDGKLVAAITSALDAGFTHIDGAEVYNTEKEIGAAIAAHLATGRHTREQLFITTKIYPRLPDVKNAFKDSLANLGLTYVDLYLIHAPFKEGVDLKQVWRDLEALVDEGVVRDIGVSNFRVSDLESLLSYARIKPVVNQVEAHPYLQQPELREFAHKHGILLQAYSPLTPVTNKQGGPVDEVVDRIAKAHGVTPGEVLLRWSLQLGYNPITTTSDATRAGQFLSAAAVPSPAHTTEGGATSGFTLTEHEVQEISEAGAKLKHRRFWGKEFEASGL